MFNYGFQQGRNHKSEIFYEEGMAYLRIEFDTDIKNNNGENEVMHFVIPKIGLNEITFDSTFEIPASPRKIQFKSYPDEQERLVYFYKMQAT